GSSFLLLVSWGAPTGAPLLHGRGLAGPWALRGTLRRASRSRRARRPHRYHHAGGLRLRRAISHLWRLGHANACTHLAFKQPIGRAPQAVRNLPHNTALRVARLSVFNEIQALRTNTDRVGEFAWRQPVWQMRQARRHNPLSECA